MKFVILILAFIDVAISKHLGSLPLLKSFLEVSLIFTDLTEKLSFSMKIVIFPISFVFVSLGVQVNTEAVLFIFGKHALIAEDVRLYPHSFAISFHNSLPATLCLSEIHLSVVEPNQVDRFIHLEQNTLPKPLDAHALSFNAESLENLQRKMS